jgi:hypothetical protein
VANKWRERGKTNRIWIVEMWHELDERYYPTTGLSLLATAGREDLREWRKAYPRERFRLRCYVPIVLLAARGLVT